MADPDWKKRVGITINYSSGEEDDSVEFRTKPQTERGVEVGGEFGPVSSTDDLLTRYEEYGSTPPRTRIKIKNRDWDRKQRMEGNGRKNAARMTRSRVNRRNTMDCAILNEMFVEDEHKRTDKRTLQLQREADREIKLSSMATAAVNQLQNRHSRPLSNASIEERTESLPSTNATCVGAGGTLIECSNKYMSVQSRPVGCRMSAPPTAFGINLKLDQTDRPKIQNRQEFHETFANLIKLGSVDKQDNKDNLSSFQLSHEEYKYQTELQDLIWLELQAWHADRTLEQQDKYLYAARQGICDLLNEIMSYRFQPKFSRTSSVASDTDSGMASDSASSTQDGRFPMMGSQPCTGCLSMYCRDCQDQQGLAMKQVEVLLTRLEAAEALFPSTQALGQCYPIYKSVEFVGRVKAMCLWYNITRHQRLKLMILGKLMARAQSEPFAWPVAIEERHRLSTVSLDTVDSGRDSVDSKCTKISPPKVQFTLDERNESGSSNDSTISGTSLGESKEMPPTPPVGDFGKLVNEVNLFSREPTSHSSSPYRKYIENVLKSRGLGKSLNFLHRLHNVVLRKAQITLEKPGSEESDEGELFEMDSPIIEPPIEKEQEEELRRFGIWSAEFEQLALPSYVPSFVFLSLIPMEVIHEFLRLRLETRPMQPNPLSLEQLMKELREGLILAITHRERYSKHITTALCEKEPELEKYIGILEEFDKTVKRVMELYLDYVEQWVLIAAPEGHQRSALDKEWMFTKLVCPMIPGQHSSAARRFCMIVRNLLKAIGERLVTRATELDDRIDETAHGEASKWEILAICRATQSLFTEERERAVKVMAFAKALIRDIEHSDFHRDHNEEFISKCSDDFVCLEVKEAITVLKRDALKVREKLTTIIEMVEERCHVKHIADLDEVDKAAVLTRSREILHQGYKFGFEYHRDLVKMMETKGCKDSKCEFNLSLGIIGFAKMWMRFVMERCERGRGLRPRWAAQGFDFLIIACDPSNSRHLNEKEFEEMKAMMDKCISHVIGITTEPQRKRPSPRSRKTSPANRKITPSKMNVSAGSQKNLMPQMSLREEAVGLSPTSTPDSPDMIRKQTSCDTSTNGISIVVPQITNFTQPLRQIRVRDSVNRLDLELESKLRERNLIGQVKSLNTCDKVHIRSRSVTFRWHRGIKIGQGRFGKVYTAVNNSTGELMAMKEITIQPGENRAIRRVAEELKIFEGITHKHLVKYYGVEIHREELLIFMELCSEGTLESLVEMSGGLYESLTRRFTAQLLSAVGELHKHGIVHRDVKTANIFLTNGSNCLKLGDFGSAVKLQTHTTVPGELQGYVGTQAYMAPEVFTKNNTEGHGRAADIWSVGCVVIEMASGKRPWAQFDSNFQIMFKVGMGETPEVPDSLSQEGHDFLKRCLQHDPKSRLSANELLFHNFCKVGIEDDCSCDDKRHQDIRRSKRQNKTKS